MPILNWIGKDAVVNHDKDVPFRLLKKNKSKSVGDSENLIIEGDNLEALKALLPHYQNKIKCIYIDPPYNTGNEKWVYNDNVNSPKIKKWLGKVVGKEEEDLSRHDKWLCMMYPRLKLLKELLNDDEGSIWISIDDTEIRSLRSLMDEIFGPDKFIACNVWQKRYSRENREAIGDVHEYILVYASNPKRFKKIRNLLGGTEKQIANYSNPNNDPKGKWRPIPIDAQEGHATAEQFYEIETPSGKKHRPPKGRCWGISETVFQQYLSQGRIYFGKKNDGVPNLIRYLSEVEGFAPWTWWPHEDVGHTDEAKKEIHAIFGTKENSFETPKPMRLLEQILKIATNPGDIVLDSFAGSGTTGHVVLKLNNEDDGNRKFILVELEPDVCKNITSQRITKAIKGYSYEGTNSIVLDKKKLTVTDLKNMSQILFKIDDIKIKNSSFDKFELKFSDNTITLFGKNKSAAKRDGLGGGFQYAVLDKKLFNSDGRINPDCTFEELASYVYFTETKKILDTKKISKTRIDTYNDTEYHLIFNEIGKNNLDRKFLTSLVRDQNKIIYADKCTLDDNILEKHNTIFKQIPYEVRVF